MSEIAGFRPLSNEEKLAKDGSNSVKVVELKDESGGDSIERQFWAHLPTIESSYTQKYKPFCYRCAFNDFMAELKTKQSKINTYHGDLSNLPKETFDIDFIKRDYSKYSTERFVEMGAPLVKEKKIIDGMPVQMHTGWDLMFKCKECGANVAIFKPKVEDATPDEQLKVALGTKAPAIEPHLVPNNTPPRGPTTPPVNPNTPPLLDEN